MNAPVLSPTERDETTRFGIHDDEAFANIVEHFDETPECAMGGHRAHARLIANCCDNPVVACEQHIRSHLVWVEAHLVLAAGVQCVKCAARFRYPATVADVCREVPL